ncbi:hypothetical protein M0811_06184 [Anaeramoeba ignava]|uniref:L domain-like protein n=1 Tax=Anaeramoeba ignava TaxID=1746090 RepID=A0A9Q0RFC2_ANAIG|nr:hypothetical protein M0811_06184 [Anaeramoeba ignava]
MWTRAKDSGKKVIAKYKVNENKEIIEADLSRIGTTKIPTKICEEIIGHQSSIQILDIGYNQISSLEVFNDLIFHLKDLRVLRLNNNFFTNLPKNFVKNLSKLEILDVSNNSLSQINEQSNFPNLTHFYGRNNYWGIFPNCISNSPNVRYIDMRIGQLTNLPKNIENLENLEYLDLSNNALRSVNINLEKLKKLKYLNLSSNKLTQFEISSNDESQLSELDLLYNKFSIFPATILSLKKIKKLDLSFNRLEIPNEIEKLTSLEILRWNSNQIQKIPKNISKLKNNLKEFWLRYNSFYQFPKELLELENITLLDLTGNGLKKLPDEISSKLPNLERIYLAYNNFQKIPNVLKKLQKPLKRIWLDNNPMKKEDKKIVESGMKKLLNYLFPSKKDEKIINNSNIAENQNKEIVKDDSNDSQIKQQKVTRNLDHLKKKEDKKKDEKIIDNSSIAENQNKEIVKDDSNDSQIKQQKVAGNLDHSKKKNMDIDLDEKKKDEKIIDNSNIAENQNKEIVKVDSNDSQIKQQKVAGNLDHSKKKSMDIDLDEKNQKNQSLIVMPQNATKLSIEELKDKIRGTIIGNCIGDAVGLATEFLDKKNSSYFYDFEFFDYEKLVNDGHRSRWIKGDWTDDSDQMLLILDGILENNGKVDEKDFARRLLNWIYNGFRELGDSGGMGLGSTVGAVVSSNEFLDNPHYCAEVVWEKNE